MRTPTTLKILAALALAGLSLGASAAPRHHHRHHHHHHHHHVAQHIERR